MRPTVPRAAGLVAALVVLVATGVSAALAASPIPTVGGVLDVSPTAVVVTSTATLRQVVILTVDPPTGATLTPARLELAPGDSARIEVAGPATGTVAAAFTAVDVPGEAVGVVLRAPFHAHASLPPAGLPLAPVLAVLALAAVGLGAWSIPRRRRGRARP